MLMANKQEKQLEADATHTATLNLCHTLEKPSQPKLGQLL
jgi:hypothetical protein